MIFKMSSLVAAAVLLSCVSQANASGGCYTQWSLSQHRLVWNCGGHHRRPMVLHRRSWESHERVVVRSHREVVGRPGGNPHRAEQQAMCEEQAEKRRALGIDSRVIWDNPNTCRATGGFVESGRL